MFWRITFLIKNSTMGAGGTQQKSGVWKNPKRWGTPEGQQQRCLKAARSPEAGGRGTHGELLGDYRREKLETEEDSSWSPQKKLVLRTEVNWTWHPQKEAENSWGAVDSWEQPRRLESCYCDSQETAANNRHLEVRWLSSDPLGRSGHKKWN